MRINFNDIKTIKQFSSILFHNETSDSYVCIADMYLYDISNHNLCVCLDTDNFPIKKWKSFYTIGGILCKKSFNIWWIAKVLQI